MSQVIKILKTKKIILLNQMIQILSTKIKNKKNSMSVMKIISTKKN